MGGCQNYGSFLGTLNNRCRIITGTQKGTIILTTTHIDIRKSSRSMCKAGGNDRRLGSGSSWIPKTLNPKNPKPLTENPKLLVLGLRK